MTTFSLKVGSLFSGGGLCDLGLQMAGFTHAWFCEIDPFCQTILTRRWPGKPIYENIKNLKGTDLPKVDVLAGGFPCQDISIGGKRAGIKTDTRSGLWLEYARLISEICPRYVLIENVRGLLSCGFEVVLRSLADIGYDAEWVMLSASDLGAPHRRERIFIVAYPNVHRGGLWSGVLSPLGAILADYEQSGSGITWNGIPITRSSRQTIRELYGRRVLCRVDDGSAGKLELPGRVELISRMEAISWRPRLKLLGNGITPMQAFAIGMCIRLAEGVSPLSFPEQRHNFFTHQRRERDITSPR